MSRLFSNNCSKVNEIVLIDFQQMNFDSFAQMFNKFIDTLLVLNFFSIQGQIFSTDLFQEPTSSSSMEYSTDSIEVDQWINVNQTDLFWKKIHGDSLSYFLQSQRRCLHRMCSNQFQYIGPFSKRKTHACLSFILSTRGQPIGQIWIEDDDEQRDKFSQKIQLTNSTLRIEHSFRSNIRSLSIHCRILFPNPKFDGITLSNLNIHFNGSCRKSQEDHETFSLTDQITTEEFQSTEQFHLSTTTTTKSEEKENQLNFILILSLIILFCCLMIISSIIYGIWTIVNPWRSFWSVPFEYPIQFLSRKSLSSSSTNHLETLEEICRENSFDSLTVSDLHSYF